jgi:hypothetical protein
MSRIDAGGFRRVLRAMGPGFGGPLRPAMPCPRRGISPYEAVPLSLGDALAGLERRVVPGLPPDVSREIRDGAEACARERAGTLWLVLHADGAFEALPPVAFAALREREPASLRA